MKRRRRAFTMVEVMVGSGVLLLMVALASMATISYLRGYGHYTKEGAKLRLASKTLESLCFELRSARSLQKIPQSLRQGALEFENARRQFCSLQLRRDQLWVFHDKEEARIGQASDVVFKVEANTLEIGLVVSGQAPLTTALSLRGVRR